MTVGIAMEQLKNKTIITLHSFIKGLLPEISKHVMENINTIDSTNSAMEVATRYEQARKKGKVTSFNLLDVDFGFRALDEALTGRGHSEDQFEEEVDDLQKEIDHHQQQRVIEINSFQQGGGRWRGGSRNRGRGRGFSQTSMVPVQVSQPRRTGFHNRETPSGQPGNQNSSQNRSNNPSGYCYRYYRMGHIVANGPLQAITEGDGTRRLVRRRGQFIGRFNNRRPTNLRFNEINDTNLDTYYEEQEHDDYYDEEEYGDDGGYDSLTSCG